MEKDIKLGSNGDLDISLTGGKALIKAEASFADGVVHVGASISCDAGALIDALKKAIEVKYPASMPVDEAVFGLLKSAVSSL